MKLKTKLIPIIAATSVVATATPITLTSCGYRYTDVLHALYKPGVTPYKKTTVYSDRALATLYTNRVAKNQDVLRDDVLFTWSTLLHENDSKNNIDKCILYDQFNLDLHLYTEEDVVTESSNAYGPTVEEITVLHVESHVAGTNKMTDSESHMYIEEGKIIDQFDFDFDVEIRGVQNITYAGNEGYNVADVFGDLHLMQIAFQDAYVCINLNGSYTLQGENVTHDIDHESEYWVANDGTDINTLSPLYRMFGLTVLALPQYSIDQQKTNSASISSGSVIHFFSHYLKNVKLVSPPEP